MPTIIDKINQEQLKKETAKFNVGDSVRVHTIVKEGDKERVQIFTGIVIGRKGRDINATFTVRRISYGEGVERVFPTHSPRIAKVTRDRLMVAMHALHPEYEFAQHKGYGTPLHLAKLQAHAPEA